MRRRGSGEGVRESLAAWYWELSELYDQPGNRQLGKIAEALDAGKPMVVPAYEVDGMGVHGLVQVNSDGSVAPVDWDPANCSYEVIQ